MKKWTQQEALDLCVMIERHCPTFGCHVALTGGLLYKQGARKDLDLILYRIRQCDAIDFDGLFKRLTVIGIVDSEGGGWCYKAFYDGKRIDFLIPEEQGNEYPEQEEEVVIDEATFK